MDKLQSTVCGPCERPTVTEQTSSTETPRRIVVAGGGPAAHRFADAMHARGLEGWHVTVLTEEAHLPYDRVALSKALTDSDVDLTLGAASMWDHDALNLKTGERVIKINHAAKSVETAAGNSYEFDELVVATGSDAARLPIPGAEHVHVYRTLEDVWAINKSIAELTEKLGRKINAVTIGGGLLGLESAAGTEQLGATPVVINGAPWLMNTQLDEGAGQALGRLIEAKGFEVHGGVFPSEILADDDGQVTGVLMADGRTIAADLVVVAIGVKPRDELFRAAEGEDALFDLGPRGGVVINDDCSTQVPGIWAIGEVANFGGPRQHHGRDRCRPAARRRSHLPGLRHGHHAEAFRRGRGQLRRRLRQDRARPRNRVRRPCPRRVPEDRHHRRCQDPPRRHLRRRRHAVHEPPPAPGP